MDAHANFAYSTVLTAPSPALTGTSLVVAAAEGSRFPAVPFNATIWPAGAIPLSSNAEIVRVTAIVTDTLTVTRAQESSTARSVIVGDQIAATVTAKTLTDIESGMVINDLSDVVITAGASGDVLQFNGTNWVDVALASLGLTAAHIAAGTFGAGDFVFPSDLTITDFLQGTTGNGFLDIRGDSGATVGARLTDTGLLLLGTTTAANGATRLDVFGGFPQLIMTDSLTDATNKVGALTVRHYTNSEETAVIFAVFSGVSTNILFFGGGSSILNTATEVRFYTAADTTTLSGTQVGEFDNDTTAGNTRLQLWDNDNAAMERVSVGIADSGGAGFKVLRIPN